MTSIITTAAATLVAAVLLSVGARAEERFEVNFAQPAEAAVQAEVLQAALVSSARTIDLVLRINPEVSEGRYDYHLSAARTDGSRREVDCKKGWERLGTEYTAFDLSLGIINTHLLLRIVHAGPLQAPFHHVACVYDARTGDVPVIEIRGHFAKSIVDIPTAVDVELRPFLE